MGRSVWFQRSREWSVTVAILASDLFFYSNIYLPGHTWRQGLLEVGWTILSYGALRWRNSSPVLAYGIGWVYSAGAAVLTLLRVFYFTPFFVLVLNLFTVVSERPLKFSRPALAAVAVPCALAIWTDVVDPVDHGNWLPQVIASTIFYVLASYVAWVVGRGSRSARDAVEHHRRRLALANEAARDERLRIARELHDILAHTVTIMVLQAGGARRVLACDPASADEALSHIEEVGKKTMGELRRMLALVRSPALASDEPSQRGLADITCLLGDVLKAGVTARLEVHGTPVPVAESIDRTVYRIVQEAATNIVKHSGPGTSATVRLTWGTDLRIEIIDDGGGAPVMEAGALSTGHGLLGLTERVAVFGGTLTAGPCRTGFCVQASLPLRDPDSYAPGPYPETRE